MNQAHNSAAILAIVLVVALVTVPAAVGAQARPVVRIGVTLDGPWERNAEIETLFQSQVTALNRNDFDVRFPDEARLVGDWTAEAAERNLEQLLLDPEVDIVFAMGVLASAAAVRRADLPKPTLAPFIIDEELQGLSRDPETGGSGISNLAYVTTPWGIDVALDALQALTDFEKVGVLVDARFAAAVPFLPGRIEGFVRDIGRDHQVVPVGSTVGPALAALDPDVDAIMVGALLNLPNEEFDRLVAGLIERRLPSMSLFGRSEVERGLLFGVFPDTDFQRVARRVAIDTQRILLGEPAATLPVELEQGQRLTMNMATARAIGYSPAWDTMTRAEIINGRRTDVETVISLNDAVDEALAANLDYQASERVVEAGEQQVREARSALLPQVDVGARTLVIDAERANSSFGQQSQRTLSAAVGLTQVIYADDARTGVDVERFVQESTVLQRQVLRLDVIVGAATSYLDVLRALVLEEVEQQNLILTRANLQLAETRLQVGTSSRADVFRWQSEVALNRRRVIDASAQRNLAQIELNRIRNRPLEESFRLADPLLDEGGRGVISELLPYIGDVDGFKTFRDFMVDEGLRASPELAAIDAAIDAQRRLLVNAERSFWLPRFVFQGDIAHVVSRGGAGSEPPAGFFAEPPDTTWSAAFDASLTAYRGSGRYARRDRIFAELAVLRLERRATAERVEQRVRSNLHLMGASYAGIGLAEEAAAAARSNLDLVQDAYSQGVVDVIVLLDAQNAALVAELAAATAVFDFLSDLIEVGRSISRFDFLVASPDRQAWFERLDRYFESAGGGR